MKIAVQQGSTLLQAPVEADGILWIVVYDKFDQPIAAIEQLGDQTIHVTTVSDAKFAKVIERLAPHKALPSVQNV